MYKLAKKGYLNQSGDKWLVLDERRHFCGKRPAHQRELILVRQEIITTF